MVRPAAVTRDGRIADRKPRRSGDIGVIAIMAIADESELKKATSESLFCYADTSYSLALWINKHSCWPLWS